MSAISQSIANARARGRAAFIPYVTGGFPHDDACAELIAGLDEVGAEVIEIGVPFSDPVADGPVIQAASQKALEAGATPAGVIELASRVAPRVKAPLVLMTYWNPVLALGQAEFARRAVDAGVAGCIVPDLPPEEAGPWIDDARAAGLDTIFLAAPTTPDRRLAMVSEITRGFLYYVSMTGVTGSALAADEGLLAQIARVKAASAAPVAVGFGVAQPEQAKALAPAADGVIVGSALVKRVLEADTPAAGVASALALAAELSAALTVN